MIAGMGVFDLPAPLLSWLDAWLGQVAPPTLRLIFWGLLAAILSMALYWLISPQQQLATIKHRALEARQALNAHDGEFAEAWPLMRRMLGLSMRQLGMTTWPALVASLPVLALICWLGTTYGYGFPSQTEAVGIQTYPAPMTARLTYDTVDPKAPARLVVADQNGQALSDIPLLAPVPTLHKKQWWNALIGNPAGYLPDDSPLERIDIGLPAQEFLTLGPSWLRPWYVLFFGTLLLGSITIKVAGRIE